MSTFVLVFWPIRGRNRNHASHAFRVEAVSAKQVTEMADALKSGYHSFEGREVYDSEEQFREMYPKLSLTDPHPDFYAPYINRQQDNAAH